MATRLQLNSERPLSHHGHKSATCLQPRSEMGVTAHPAHRWQLCDCHPNLQGCPTQAECCAPHCSPQAESSRDAKEQNQNDVGFPSAQANWSHPYKVFLLCAGRRAWGCYCSNAELQSYAVCRKGCTTGQNLASRHSTGLR